MNLKIFWIGNFVILLILLVLGMFYFLNNSQDNKYSIYKVYPGDTDIPGGPDYYESVCLKSDIDSNLSNKFVSKNRQDYYFIEGNKETLNEKWENLFSQIEGINSKLNLDLVEFIYDETGGNGIFITSNNSWNKLSDEEKLYFLQVSTDTITNTIFSNPNEIIYSTLLYTCGDSGNKKWVAATTNKKNELKVFFDWKK